MSKQKDNKKMVEKNSCDNFIDLFRTALANEMRKGTGRNAYTSCEELFGLFLNDGEKAIKDTEEERFDICMEDLKANTEVTIDAGIQKIVDFFGNQQMSSSEKRELEIPGDVFITKDYKDREIWVSGDILFGDETMNNIMDGIGKRKQCQKVFEELKEKGIIKSDEQDYKWHHNMVNDDVVKCFCINAATLFDDYAEQKYLDLLRYEDGEMEASVGDDEIVDAFIECFQDFTKKKDISITRLPQIDARDIPPENPNMIYYNESDNKLFVGFGLFNRICKGGRVKKISVRKTICALRDAGIYHGGKGPYHLVEMEYNGIPCFQMHCLSADRFIGS